MAAKTANYNVIANTERGQIIPRRDFIEEVDFGMHERRCVYPVRRGFYDISFWVDSEKAGFALPQDCTHVFLLHPYKPTVVEPPEAEAPF